MVVKIIDAFYMKEVDLLDDHDDELQEAGYFENA